MKHLILLLLWLLQPSFTLRAEQIMIPATNILMLTERRLIKVNKAIKKEKKRLKESIK
jgi:hypothetical protein